MGIGWSPDDRRLVFEGGVNEAGEYTEYLWTIKTNGTGLRRSIEASIATWSRASASATTWPGQPTASPTLATVAWFSVHQGEERLLVRNVRRLYISGNGRWLFVSRASRTGSFWTLRPNGDGLERIISKTSPHPGMGYLMPLVPNYTGRRLLTRVDSPTGPPSLTFLHPATRAPRASDPRLNFTDGAYVVTWN